MSIVLSEIRTAVQTYLNTKVNTTISAITPDGPATLNPNEEGSFKVEIANALAGAGGVRLVNVRYHLRTTTPALLKFKVPPVAVAAAKSGVALASPALTPGTFVSEMFLFPGDNSLDAGDIDTLNGLKVKATALGNANITCHVHADIDMEYLFPKNEDSSTANRSISIV